MGTAPSRTPPPAAQLAPGEAKLDLQRRTLALTPDLDIYETLEDVRAPSWSKRENEKQEPPGHLRGSSGLLARAGFGADLVRPGGGLSACAVRRLLAPGSAQKPRPTASALTSPAVTFRSQQGRCRCRRLPSTMHCRADVRGPRRHPGPAGLRPPPMSAASTMTS